jgi:2-haloacid dehalogenase
MGKDSSAAKPHDDTLSGTIIPDDHPEYGSTVTTTTTVVTEHLPANFQNVKAFVFDVFTFADWKTTVETELATLAQSGGFAKKQDWRAFAVKWKAKFDARAINAVRLQSGGAAYLKSDTLLRNALDEVIDECGLNDKFTENQLVQLSLVWHRLSLYEDSLQSIKSIKEKYIAATFSNFSFRTLVDLARHCSVCWNANISTEFFASYKPDATVYGRAADILELKPNQIAIVSYDIADLQAASASGFATVLALRDLELEKGSGTKGVDVVVKDLKGIVTIVEEASKPKSWFQRAVNDVVELATGHAQEDQ